MSSGLVFTTGESPFIDQLIQTVWKLVTGNFEQPSVTGRETFRDALINPDQRKTIERINLRDGKPWLDDARISQAMSVLEVAEGKKLRVVRHSLPEDFLAGRMRVTGLLTEGAT
jgi:type I restriction enzyme R subunit